MTELFYELISEGFEKEDVEEIIARIMMGESIDAAIQSVF